MEGDVVDLKVTQQKNEESIGDLKGELDKSSVPTKEFEQQTSSTTMACDLIHEQPQSDVRENDDTDEEEVLKIINPSSESCKSGDEAEAYDTSDYSSNEAFEITKSRLNEKHIVSIEVNFKVTKTVSHDGDQNQIDQPAQLDVKIEESDEIEEVLNQLAQDTMDNKLDETNHESSSGHSASDEDLSNDEIEDKEEEEFYEVENLQRFPPAVRHKLALCATKVSGNLILYKKNVEQTTQCFDSERPKLLLQLQLTEKKNEKLYAELEEYKRLQEVSIERANDATDLLQTYEERLNFFVAEIGKMSNALEKNRVKFAIVLRNRNSRIKEARENNQELINTITSNKKEIAILKTAYKKLQSRYAAIEFKEQQKDDEIKRMRNTMENLEKELIALYEACKNIKTQNETFLTELNETIRFYDTKDTARVKLIEDNRILARHLNNKIQEIENLKKEFERSSLETQTKFKKLLHDYTELINRFEEYKKFDDKKCEKVENELRDFTLLMKEKQETMIMEKVQMEKIIDFHNEKLKESEAQIHELKKTIEENEKIINEMKLSSEKEKEKLDSEKQIFDLHNEELKEKLQTMNEESMKEIESLKTSLNQKQETCIANEKIIVEQLHTIMSIREQLETKSVEIEEANLEIERMTEENKRLLDRLSNMEQELVTCEEEKRGMKEKLQEVNIQMETLNTQLSEFAKNVERSCGGEGENSEAYKDLKMQYITEKRDWEVQRLELQKEKDTAIKTANLAIEELTNTLNDVKKEARQQKRTAANRKTK